MKKPLIQTAVVLFIYGVVLDTWLRIYSQLQGVAGAAALNDDSIVGNAFLRYFREFDLVSLVATLILIALLFFIWRGTFNSKSE